MSVPEAVAQSSFKLRSTKMGFSHWSNNKPLARSQNAKWIDTQANSPTPSTDLPGAAVALRFTGINFTGQNPVTIGYIRFTYYITFRGQRYAQCPTVPQSPRPVEPLPIGTM